MGIRTPDLLNAIEALYQLSYDPVIERTDNLGLSAEIASGEISDLSG